MSKKFFLFVMSCFIVVPLVLTSCKAAPVEEKKPAEEKPKVEKEGPRGMATYAPSTGTMSYRSAIDPHTGVGAEQTTINCLLFDGLLTKDEKGNEVPALAKSWEIAPDWSYIDFFMQEGVKFHNGEACTAEDVKFSIERAGREDLMFVFGYEVRENVDRVEVLDDYHVRVYVTKPYPALFDRAYNNLMIVPKDYIEKVGDKGFAANPVGAGPFKIIDFKHDEYVFCEAVVDHYRKTPYVEKFRFVICEEPATRLAMLKTGEADFIMIPGTDIPEVDRDPNLTRIQSEYTFLVTMVFQDLAFPDEPSPLHDPRVRRACSLAIDREGICREILNGAGEPWGTFLAPYNAGYEYMEPDPYDLERAKELLAEAGYPNGFDTTFTCGSGDKWWMEPIAAQLNEAGIRAEFVVLEHGIWQKEHTLGELHGLSYGSGPWWACRAHPAVALDSHTRGGWAPVGRTFPEFDAAFQKIVTATSEEAIAKTAKEYNQILLDSTFRVPLWSVNAQYAVGPRVESYEPVPGLIFPIRMEYLKLKDE